MTEVLLSPMSTTTYNPGQAISDKMRKSSEMEHDYKILVSALAPFLTVIVKTLFLEGR